MYFFKKWKRHVNELVSLNLTADTHQAHTLLSKIKKKMTDMCVVNKCCVQKLEKFWASVLPKVTDNWADIGEDLKKQLATINDLYCGKRYTLSYTFKNTPLLPYLSGRRSKAAMESLVGERNCCGPD